MVHLTDRQMPSCVVGTMGYVNPPRRRTDRRTDVRDLVAHPEHRQMFLRSRSNPGGVHGGESGIRTHGTVSRTHAFQACALSHSAISPAALS